MIARSLAAEAHRVTSLSLPEPLTPEQWRASLEDRRRKWLQMLGLWPRRQRTPLQATVTGTLERDGYVVEKLHFQPVPGAYVAGNLYRPAERREPLPAVLYLCGHTKGKVNTPYQANPRWFGQHGYVALVLDPIQLGECQGYHGGTIFKGRFDWFSRGYTPAGTEVWNAMRALDYLETRDDVDGTRMGVTGLSGGGAMSWFLAAADERIKCAVPVCQTGTIEQQVADRTIDGHCDCAYWLNTHRWCTPDIGALIAPRPLLVAAGTEDVLWRPYAFREAVFRISKQYKALGVAENCRLVEDTSPHGYTPVIRKAVFGWFDKHLRGDDTPVSDDVTDHLEPEADLLVFGGDLPEADGMKDIDRTLIAPAALPAIETEEAWAVHQQEALADLRQSALQRTDCREDVRLCEVRSAGASGECLFGQTWVFEADGIELRGHLIQDRRAPVEGAALMAAPQDPEQTRIFLPRLPVGPAVHSLTVDVRGTGATSLGPGFSRTARRLYMLVGQTLPERQVHDLLAAIRLVREHAALPAPRIAVYGKGAMAPQAIYAALLCPDIGEIVLEAPPESHTDPQTAEFLAVLQVGDLPHNLALAYPRPITFVGGIPGPYAYVERLYAACGHGPRVRTVSQLADWGPVVSVDD